MSVAWVIVLIGMKCECDLREYVLVHHWYALICTGRYKAFLKHRMQTFCDFGLWDVILGVWDEYVVVLKLQNTGPFPRKFMSFNKYIYVCTDYIRVHTGMYPVYQNLSEDTVFVTFDSGQR